MVPTSGVEIRMCESAGRIQLPLASDLDNCIVAGDAMVLKTDYALLEKLTKGSLPWDYHHFVGLHGGKTFEQIVRDTRRELGLSGDDRTLQCWVGEELDHVVAAIKRGDLAEVPGAARVIRELVSTSRDVVVVSSSHRRRVEASLSAVGLSDSIPPASVKSAQSDYYPPRPKPDPSCYVDMTLQRMAHDTKGGWAIEDSVSGLVAAAGARDVLREQIANRGFDFSIIWFTGMVEPGHYSAWKQRAVDLEIPFEVASWDQVPHLFELVESGKKAEALKRYGLLK
jgi:beta-phosphoglucomutase-like phosphatase (HAD superfamily)